MPKGNKKRMTPAQKAAKKQRQKEYMTVFINGKQKRVKRPETIDGLAVDEFIRRNAGPIWLHQNELWEYIQPEPSETSVTPSSEDEMRKEKVRSLSFPHASASEAGDFYQVLFEDHESKSSTTGLKGDYLLISKGFEFFLDDKVKIETDDLEFIGEYEVIEADLKSNQLTIRMKRERVVILEVHFKASKNLFSKIRDTLRTMIPHLHVSEMETVD